MVVDEATKLFHHGRFEEALELVENELLSIQPENVNYIKLMKLQCRLYYHLGRGDQALYYVQQLLLHHEDLETKTAKAIYQFGQGHVLEARGLINSITIQETIDDELDDRQSHMKGLSNYHYLQGSLLEYDGELVKAEEQYKEALHYNESLNEPYDSNIIIYKLATIARQRGFMDQAIGLLKESLELSRQLDLTQEIATTSTLLGQDMLLRTEYETALPYLEEGVDHWQETGSPFGTIWALGELAIVDFLQGNTETALQHYTTIIQLAEDIMPPVHFSTHLLNAIRFAVESMNKDLALKFLVKLEEIKSDNEIINHRYTLAKVLVDKLSERISYRLRNTVVLRQLSAETTEFLITYDAILEDIDLLLLEYRITEDSTVQSEILDEADERLDQLLQEIRLRMGISFELHAASLRAKIAVLRADPQGIHDLLSTMKTEEISTNTIEQEVKEFMNNNDYIVTGVGFDFDKELQSIPSLKILFYLLPRPKASFSEMEKATELSAGHLSGKCQKLEDLGFISKQKEFIDEKPVTTFVLTPQGYVRLKQYMQSLSSYLHQIF